MSIKDNFSEDEWFLLSSLPAMIGAAMSSAASSGVVGTVRELAAGMRATVAGLTDYPQSELVQTLLEKADNWGEAKEKITDYRARVRDKLQAGNIKSREQLHSQVISDCKVAALIVEAKCSAEDARIYKEWTMKVADNVAAAASEGGFLGFGGERISAEETEMLEKIGAALGIDATALMA